MGVPWWGWLIIAVVGSYALLYLLIAGVILGGFWRTWNGESWHSPVDRRPRRPRR